MQTMEQREARRDESQGAHRPPEQNATAVEDDDGASSGARGRRRRQRHASLGLDAASVALPAGIDLDDRAARMNEFWRALVEFQYRDVLVVALCAGDER
jgi:hypothetical protein